MGPQPGQRVAVARVKGGGTAFAIAGDLALTAFHVVREARAGHVEFHFAVGPPGLLVSHGGG